MSHEEFIKLYFQNLPKYDTYTAAYNATEEFYKLKFGKNKYSTYNVFRATLSRWTAINGRL